MKRTAPFRLLLLLVGAMDCKAFSGVSPIPTVESVLTATPGLAANLTPSSTQQSTGELLFEDEFSDPKSGWIETDQTVLSLAYVDGKYRAVVKGPYVASFSAFPNLHFNDASIEADAQFVTGSTSNLFGLLCRATATPDLQSGYEMLISPAGAASIVKITGAQATQEEVLRQGKSNLIRTGAATNLLRMDCSGDRLTTYVNGQQLMQATDAAYGRGRAGFTFGTNNNPGLEVRFDNFTVRQAVP